MICRCALIIAATTPYHRPTDHSRAVDLIYDPENLPNDDSNLIPTEQLSFYFDKKCMRVSRRCGDASAFVFDVRYGYTLRASTSAEFRNVESESHCAQACLDEECKAFVWESKNRKLLIYPKTMASSDHYSEVSLKKKGEGSFTGTRSHQKTRWVGNQTVDGCLTACMSSPKKCGAVNYDVSSTNCYLMSTNKTDKEATIGKDKMVSAVIVMSNDRVLPHDVTTKDDLFFHVTCNYTATTLNEVRQGIVVG
ncbi:PAN domain protein [Teladorsagia circumcincta]|uniref:PAN domain protein n=1 Tax=Teladorsagia circumcincta TaxID=45464 RepID=A0A2G9TXP9_TELCI|nr:PAN domain protein [Teladorsagia circumcincta]